MYQGTRATAGFGAGAGGAYSRLVHAPRGPLIYIYILYGTYYLRLAAQAPAPSGGGPDRLISATIEPWSTVGG